MLSRSWSAAEQADLAKAESHTSLKRQRRPLREPSLALQACIVPAYSAALRARLGQHQEAGHSSECPARRSTSSSASELARSQPSNSACNSGETACAGPQTRISTCAPSGSGALG